MNLGAATENPWLSLPWEEKQEAGLWMASITTRKFREDCKQLRRRSPRRPRLGVARVVRGAEEKAESKQALVHHDYHPCGGGLKLDPGWLSGCRHSGGGREV